MNHKFEQGAFVCINISGTPNVVEVGAGQHMGTIHPWTQHDTLDAAIAAAQEIDPDYQHDGGHDGHHP